MKTVHLSVFSLGKKTKFLCDDRNNDNRHTKVSKNQQTTQATMAQSGARKSHNLKVVSSSLTGRSSRRIILLALYPTLHFYKKKEKLLTKSIASRTEINFVRLIKSIYKKYQIVPQSRKKRVTNARDVRMKTVHLSVFSFGKKIKFLCDQQNNGNRHIKE